MFEQAVRLKFRFVSTVGASGLSVEDLWDLPLTSSKGRANLNDVAKEVSRQLKAETEEDFVNPKSGTNEILQQKLDIVKHIIHVRQTEAETARAQADRQEKKARILEIIAKKQDQDLEGKPLEELTAMVAGL